MIIKAGSPEGILTKVYKDGKDISSDCMEVDSNGVYAILVKRDRDGNVYQDPENNFLIAKEKIKDVQVIIGGELI